MFTLFFRSMILYVLMILVMRGMGKRELGQFQPYELVMAILLADIFATPMESVSTPLFYGIVPVAALFVVHSVISLLSLRFDWVRAAISGKPAVVISRGRVNQDELRRLCMSLSDLLEGLRCAGILDPTEVGTAVIEANGTLTAFQHAACRPPTAREMGVDVDYEGLPLPLVMDGRLQKNNLKKSGLSLDRLTEMLSERGMAIEGVYLAMLDTRGRVTVTAKGGDMFRFRAMDEGEVTW